MSIDVPQLMIDIKGAVSDVLEMDVATLRGFSERQVEALARQTKLVAQGIASGEITEATREFFLDGIEDMALSFVKTLRGLVMVTVEKVWNAVVGVIWSAVSKAAGIVLPFPNLG